MTSSTSSVGASSSEPIQAIRPSSTTSAWIGSDDDAPTDDVDDVIDLDGALVTPGFVDAHAHVLETGFALTGVDLSAAPSLAAALDAVARGTRLGPDPLLGHGWDETAWPERRPPTREELDRATGDGVAYLSRVDLHSAVVSTALADRAGCAEAAGWR